MMIRKISALIVVLASLSACCQRAQFKATDFPDQSGMKKGPGLLSNGDDGFVVTWNDIVNKDSDSK